MELFAIHPTSSELNNLANYLKNLEMNDIIKMLASQFIASYLSIVNHLLDNLIKSS